MLPIEQIMPFIRHDDPLVVDLAMRCLEWVRWPERLTGDFVLDAIRDGHDQLVRWLDHFTPTPAVLDYALAALAERNVDRDKHRPYGAVARAPDTLFTPTVIEAVGGLDIEYAWVAEQTRWRFDMLAWPTERLRGQLLAACDAADEDGSARSGQHEISALADRLVYRGDSIEWAADELGKRLGSNGWAEVWLLAMLIKSRHRPALDVAIGRWPTTNPDKNESLTLECSYAIPELATAADLPRVVGLWETLDPRNRSYLIEAVGRMRAPEAEEVVLDLARRTDDAGLRTYAAIGLCEMLCTGDASLQFVRDLVEREEFDTTQIGLEEPAIALGIILGRPFPEAAGWRERLGSPAKQKERRARFRSLFGPGAAALMEELDRLRDGGQLPQGDGRDALSVARGAFSAPSPYSEPRPAQLTRAATVGRNDPCPCGSGKKYKKCCLK